MKFDHKGFIKPEGNLTFNCMEMFEQSVDTLLLQVAYFQFAILLKRLRTTNKRS